jgi:hypothetical protein
MEKLIRDYKVVLNNLIETENNQVLTKVSCKVQIPSRFIDVSLAEVSTQIYSLGCFPIILETGHYAVINVNAIIELCPFKILTTKIEDVLYHEFYFNPGDVVIKNTTLVKRDSIMYNLFDEFIFKGKIPWYINYEDLGKLFDTSKENAGCNIAENLETIELIASLVTRSSSDRSKYIRNVITTYEEATGDNIDFIPLMSVFYAVNSTLNKIAGNYFNDGVVSALINKTTSVDTIENILRS